MQSGWAKICQGGSRPSLLHTRLLLREICWPPAFERVGNGEARQELCQYCWQVCSGPPTRTSRVLGEDSQHLGPRTTLAKCQSCTQVMNWVPLQPGVSTTLREQSRT